METVKRFRAREAGVGGDSHIKVTGMLIVSVGVVNYSLWPHLGCLGWKVTIFAHLSVA